MIGRLAGHIVHESPDGMAVVDVGGVGYEVMLPQGSLGRARRDAEGRVTLCVHTHVREDAIVLFGFADEIERTAFRLLTSVNGVGPRIAVGVLGVLPPTELASAVARGEARALQSVPGIGKKLAERLVLELKDRIAAGVLPMHASNQTSGPRAAPPPTSANRERASAFDDSPGGRTLHNVSLALARMGFRANEAERAAASLAGREAEPVETLLRDALKVLTQ